MIGGEYTIDDSCNGCGVCAIECPEEAIWIRNGKAEIEQDDCNSCGMCVNLCRLCSIHKL